MPTPPPPAATAGPKSLVLHAAARHLHRLVTDEHELDAALARSVELGLDD